MSKQQAAHSIRVGRYRVDLPECTAAMYIEARKAAEKADRLKQLSCKYRAEYNRLYDIQYKALYLPGADGDRQHMLYRLIGGKRDRASKAEGALRDQYFRIAKGAAQRFADQFTWKMGSGGHYLAAEYWLEKAGYASWDALREANDGGDMHTWSPELFAARWHATVAGNRDIKWPEKQEEAK